jgi:ABC-type transport system involved in cytochrome c biogenesis ATPase subunit
MLISHNVQHNNIKSSLKNPLSFEIQTGELCFIRGKNGSGKTTLLRIIANLIQPDEGFVSSTVDKSYLGPLVGLKAKSTLGRFLKCHERHQSSKNYDDLFKIENSDTKNRTLESFSSGQQMAIRLRGILIQNHPLWILDEPTRFLDRKAEQDLWQSLKIHCQLGGSAIIASHDPILLPDLEFADLDFKEIVL